MTGGSDGTGFEICRNLARQGFNICIVARSEKKINEKLEQIKSEIAPTKPSFQTRCIVADFTRLATIDDYQNKIGEKLKDIDLAVLVLNAGVLFPGDLTDLSDQEVQDSIRCLNI